MTGSRARAAALPIGAAKIALPDGGSKIALQTGAALPDSVRQVEELRLLAGRLHQPPSLGRGCAPVSREARRCLGRGLPAPLLHALITEQIEDRQVVAVLAEEGHADPAAAASRHAALLLALRTALPAPAREGDRLIFTAPPYQVHLEQTPGPGGTALIALELRQPLPAASATRGGPRAWAGDHAMIER